MWTHQTTALQFSTLHESISNVDANAFLDTTNCIYGQCFLEVFRKPCNNVLYTIILVLNAVLPKGSEVTGIHCSIIAWART